MWKATKGQVRGTLRRIPRPGRGTLLLMLGLAAAGVFILPKLPPVMSPRLVPVPGRPLPQGPNIGLIPDGDPPLGARPALEELRSQDRHRAKPYVLTSATAPGDPQGMLWGRRIIRRATLEVQLADVDRGIARLAEVIEAHGGYLAETQSHTDATGPLRATITAYVPPERFGRALAGLEDLGRITSRRIAGQDVSEEFVDLEARARNLERHEAQLLSFMGKAQKVADLLSLENELARVRGEVERLAGRMRFLKARTEMASIQVGLVRAPVATPPDGVLARLGEQVRTAFLGAWVAAFRVAAALIVLAAQASPLSVPALAAWVLYRRWARRRPLPSPPAPTA